MQAVQRWEWTPEREYRLNQLWKWGYGPKRIARSMSTSVDVIRRKLEPKKKGKPGRPSGRVIKWTQRMDDTLREMRMRGASLVAIGRELHLSQHSITHRLIDLGIPTDTRNHWHDWEDDKLREMWTGGARMCEIKLALGKTHGSIHGRVFRLGLSGRPKIETRRVERRPKRVAAPRPKKQESAFNPANKKIITENAAREALRRAWMQRRILLLEPDSMRRAGEPIYRAKFL